MMTGHLWDQSVLSYKQIERLKKWILAKQDVGFHGRANKADDSCYAFWLGATLKVCCTKLKKCSFFLLNAKFIIK